MGKDMIKLGLNLLIISAVAALLLALTNSVTAGTIAERSEQANAEARKLVLESAETFEEVDKNRMYALGGSQGGGLAIACAALSPQIKKVVAYYPFLSDYKYAYLNIESATAFDELSEYFRMFDPRQENVEKVFQKLAYIDIQNLAKYVKADVIMASGMRDSAVPVMTQFAMFNKLKTNKKYYLYPERGHEKLDDMDETAMQWLNE